MLADAEDAEWVADMYLEPKKEYSEIGFVVDLDESEAPEDMLGKFPDESVKKVRVPGLNTSIPSRVEDRVSKSIITNILDNLFYKKANRPLSFVSHPRGVREFPNRRE